MLNKKRLRFTLNNIEENSDKNDSLKLNYNVNNNKKLKIKNSKIIKNVNDSNNIKLQIRHNDINNLKINEDIIFSSNGNDIEKLNNQTKIDKYSKFFNFENLISNHDRLIQNSISSESYLDSSKINNRNNTSICCICSIIIELKSEFNLFNKINSNNSFENINIFDYEKNHFLSCFNCNKIFHIYCLKGFTENSFKKDNKSCSKLLKTKLSSFIYQEKFTCPLCLVKKIFPIFKFNYSDFFFGPFIYKPEENINESNKSNNKIINYKSYYTNNKDNFYKVESLNLIEYKKYGENPLKKICIFAVDVNRFYSERGKAKNDSNLIDYDYFFKNRIYLNKKEKDDCLTVNFFINKNFILKRDIELGKIIDITYEFRSLGNPEFEFNFSFLKHRNRKILFFLCEYENYNLENFISFYKNNILNEIYTKERFLKAKNDEIEFLVKNFIINDEILISKFEENICFSCPYTRRLIEIPVKGKFCMHIKCFELENLLKTVFKTQNNKCPICRKFIFLDELSYGFLLKEKLDQKLKAKYSKEKLEDFEEVFNLLDFDLHFKKKKSLLNGEKNIDLRIETEEWEDYDKETSENKYEFKNEFTFNKNISDEDTKFMNNINNFDKKVDLKNEEMENMININFIQNKNMNTKNIQNNESNDVLSSENNEFENINYIADEKKLPVDIIRESSFPNDIEININFGSFNSKRNKIKGKFNFQEININEIFGIDNKKVKSIRHKTKKFRERYSLRRLNNRVKKKINYMEK